MTYIHFIFIGHHKERLLSSIKHWQRNMPPSRFVLIIGEEKTSGGAKAEKVAQEMQKELRTPLFDVSIKRVSILNLLRSVKQLKELIFPLKKDGFKILLNISGSLRIFTVSAIMVAYLVQSELVSVIPKYDADFNEIGVERHIKIPILPVFNLKDKQHTILTAIGSGVESIDALVLKLSPMSKEDEKKYQGERSRVGYHINSLERKGFISRIRKGHNICVQLTEIGKIYSLMGGGLSLKQS